MCEKEIRILEYGATVFCHHQLMNVMKGRAEIKTVKHLMIHRKLEKMENINIG
jgi:hypothetical protein